jgi:hypothetical protein
MVKTIELTKGQVALVDDEDFEYLSPFNWQAIKNKKNFYARNRTNGSMHRMICFVGKNIDFGDKDVVDHINGDTLDNRRENLRVVSQRQNTQNRHNKMTSNYPGVSLHRGKWIAHILVNGEQKHLGIFKDEREAAKAYERACRELVGEELICKTGGVI